MRILMLTESNYPVDIRIKQEAEVLTNNGHSVSVIAIREDEQPSFEEINNVKVYRVPKIELFKTGKQKSSTGKNKINKILIMLQAVLGYCFEYAYFTTACFFLSFYMLFFNRFDVIHTHNPPDTLFVVALFYKFLFRKKFVYDHHDLSPDLFTEKYGDRAKIVFKILLMLEYLSCKSADMVIATNESYKEVEIDRCGVKPEQIFIVRNGPDLNKMKRVEPVESLRKKGKTVLCYIGAINIQDGVQHLILMLSKMVNKYGFKDVLQLIIGDGEYLDEVKKLAKELGVNDYIEYTGLVKDRQEINRLLSSADIFVDAAPSSFLNNRSTFIKHMEYMVFGKPVVSFDLKESMFSLKNAGMFVPSGDVDKMAETIIQLIKDDRKREEMGEYAKQRISKLDWSTVSVPLIELYRKLESK